MSRYQFTTAAQLSGVPVVPDTLTAEAVPGPARTPGPAGGKTAPGEPGSGTAAETDGGR